MTKEINLHYPENPFYCTFQGCNTVQKIVEKVEDISGVALSPEVPYLLNGSQVFSLIENVHSYMVTRSIYFQIDIENVGTVHNESDYFGYNRNMDGMQLVANKFSFDILKEKIYRVYFSPHIMTVKSNRGNRVYFDIFPQLEDENLNAFCTIVADDQK